MQTRRPPLFSNTARNDTKSEPLFLKKNFKEHGLNVVEDGGVCAAASGEGAPTSIRKSGPVHLEAFLRRVENAQRRHEIDCMPLRSCHSHPSERYRPSTLSQMAPEVLSIHAMAAKCERLFRGADHLICDGKNKYCAETI